jgi:preprotein translocase subunit SecA
MTAVTEAAVDGSAPTQDELPEFAKTRRPLPNVKDIVKNPIKFATDLTDAIPKGADRVIQQKVKQVVVPANRLEDAMRALSGPELAAKTDEFRVRLKKGETLDDLLVEAFAVVRECARRELNMRHFDVQLVGGALLHDGCICEMATGEGKTLTATLPAYLNALTGKGVHVVTVNDYLARRDGEWMGRVHKALGLTVGTIQTDMEAEQRREAYEADITYVTNTEVGFDYLRDNMATEAHELVMRRGFNYAIVDEVDSVLIDEGRNPLLITGPAEEGDEEMNKYTIASQVAAQMKENADYTVDRKQKTADLTERGMMVAEQLLGVSDIWDTYDPWGRYLLLAVKAQSLYLRDVHYIVREGQVMIVDEGTGRVQPNRRWNDNIHQAVEAKEGVEIKRENTTVASISYQCLFKLYDNLSGMTGTASTEAEELYTTYRLSVVTVPTHRENKRTDKPHAMFRTASARWNAVADLIVSCHWEGRPVLVGTTSVEHSEYLSQLLSEYRWQSQDGGLVEGVPHKLLNARPQLAAKEAEIVAQAGRANAVTIATNMAGRGTDIVLGGNPPGLARLFLERKLFPKLSAGTPEAEDASQPNPMSTVKMSPKTEAAVQAAVGLAHVTAKADGAIPVSPDSVVALVTEAVEHAEQILRGGAVKEAAEKEAAEKEKEVGGPNPVVNALRHAAVCLLDDCTTQCQREATLVRDLGGLQVIGTALHDSRRVDNQLRGRAGRQGDPGSTIFCLSMEDELMAVYCPGWASSSVWDWSGMDDDTPLFSAVVDKQLAGIQASIEDFHATHRTSTYETDRIIDGQRDAIYNVRRKVLEDGQTPLRARLIRYIEWIVDDACDRAKVDGLRPIDDWDIEGLLGDLRTVFAGRRDQWLNESGQEMGEFPHFLPGVDGEGIRAALKSKGAMPLQTELPNLEAAPEVVAAALRGVDIVDMNPPAAPARVVDTEPEAAEEYIAARVEKRMEISKGMKSLEDYGRRGMNAGEGRMLRTYLSESAIALYLDRFARLNQRYDRTDLEAVERVWALRAIDERWQRHLVEMQVLRSSVNVRAFGQLDPMEEYRIDGARAFVDMVRDMRRKTVANVFFFVGSAVEPVLDFEEVAAEEAAAVANPAAAEREAEIAKVMQATGMTSMADFISADEDAESETVLVEARARAASAGKKMQAMDDGEEKKMMEEAERVLAKQRALIEEEEDLDGDENDGSVTYKF